MSDDIAEYRKYKDGFEYMKLKDGVVLCVLNKESSSRIICSGEAHILRDFRDNILTLESNAREFAKAMSEAQYQIAKYD